MPMDFTVDNGRPVYDPRRNDLILKSQLPNNMADEESCRRLCWQTAGCNSYTFKESGCDST